MKTHLQAMLLCDFYKLSHRAQYLPETETVYSTWTPRKSLVDGVDTVVVAGQQKFFKETLIEFFNENFFQRQLTEILSEYTRIVKNTLGITEPETKHISDLHALGYLPLLIKSLPEGTVVPMRTPVMTVQNTDKRFFWLTNFIETMMSAECWKMSTSATLANEARKILNAAAMETVGDTNFVGFQGHDFSMRGMSGVRDAETTGLGHLMSFVGTDTIPAILGAERWYGANVEKELVGCSIPAAEHATVCANGMDEVRTIDRFITDIYPTGFVSFVSDTWDFWNVVGNVLPQLKDKILARDGKLVIRPDSGDPVKIICGDETADNRFARMGLVESLWEIFGGTLTAKNYKVLDSHIGAIYGDSITLDRMRKISEGLKAKGFASINCVYGIGSYTYQYVTRDTFGYAMKATVVVVKGDEKMIYKDPKTDNGTKKSQKGAVAVFQNPNTGLITWIDGLSLKDSPVHNMLTASFLNGKIVEEQTFSVIRARLESNRT